MPDYSVLLNIVCPVEKLTETDLLGLYQSLTDQGEGKCPISSHSSPSCPTKWKRKTETNEYLWSHKPDSLKDWHSIVELENTSPPPTPYHHITEVLHYSSSFYPISAPLLKKKKKLQHKLKYKKTQFEEIQQASRPDPDMAGILKLWDQEPNTALNNMLRALVDKVDNTHNRWAM